MTPRRAAPPPPAPRPTATPTARPRRPGPLAFARAFARGEAAGLTVEAVIVFPFLLWALALIHVAWDGYRSVTASLKATYTVSDLVSRQKAPIDQAYLDGMRGMLDALAGGGRAGGGLRDGPAALRVSVAREVIDSQISVEGAPDRYETTLTLEWSHASAGMAPAGAISEIEAHIPFLAPGDRIVVVETEVPWSPLMALAGIEGRRIVNVAVSRSRAGRTCWEACPQG